MNTTTPEWMNILPVSSDKLTFEQLRNFKDFHALINIQDFGPNAPASVKYAIRSFRFIYLFAVILIDEKRFPALNRCWDDLHSRFGKDFVFNDGMAAEAWIFFNFPLNKEGRTVLDEFEDFNRINEAQSEEFQQFIQAAKVSRLGLYQEILSTSRVTKFKELFTDEVISTIRSVPEYNHGEIFLGRILEVGGDRFLFGDPSCFPADRKEEIMFMVTNKMAAYGSEDSMAEDYEKFMRLSGPYWMSVVSDDKDAEILMPDHWMRYGQSEL